MQHFSSGVDEAELQDILNIIGFEKEKLPFKYLGVPLDSKRLSIDKCAPLIDRILTKIKHWTVKLLSRAGRLQLIKSVVNGIAAYWLQVFPIPKTVIHHIQSMYRSFLWSGSDTLTKKTSIAWKKICEPKNAGGLKVIDLNIWNQALFAKLVWNICAKKDTLWVKWMNVYYMKGKQFHQMNASCNWSWIFKAIHKCSSACTATNIWSTLDTGIKFPTATMYKEFLGVKPEVPWKKLLYCNYARPRALITFWMACLRRLPTKERLQRFGIINDGKCCFCEELETIDHLFFECRYTYPIWNEVLRWLKNHHQPGRWTDELKWLTQSSRGKAPKCKMLKLAAAECIYIIWLERNKRIFSDEKSQEFLAKEICNTVATRSAVHTKLEKEVLRLDGRI